MEKRLYLESVAIAGYRSYDRDFEKNRVPLRRLNVIIGANGAGKSNFISFFEMMDFMMARGLQTYTAKCGGANALLYFGAKETERICGELRFNAEIPGGVRAADPQTACYSFELEWNVYGQLFFAKEVASQKQGSELKEFDFGAGYLKSKLADSMSRYDDIPDLWRSLSRLQVFHFHDTSLSSKLREGADADDNFYIYSDGWNLAAFLYRLRRHKQYQPYYQRIVRTVRKAMPQFDDFALSPNDDGLIRLNWRQSGEEYLFGPHQISDGALRFIALTTLLLQPPQLAPAIIILDEPELGLHPYALSLLSWELREAGKNSQIILATQSPTLLNSFSCEDILTAEYDSTRRSSVLRRHSEEELKEWLNDYSLGELWEKNVLGGLPI